MSALTVVQLHAAQEPPAQPQAGGHAPAAEIDALVAEALAANRELAFYRAEIDLAQAERRAEGRLPNPEISASVGSKEVTAPSGAALGDGVAWSVAVSQSFDFPGRLSLRKAIADRRVALAKLGLEHFEQSLAARVRELAYALWTAQRMSDATHEVAERFRQLIDVLVQRSPAGVTPALETRIIEASALALHRRKVDAERELDRARLELNQLLNRPAHLPLRIADPGLPLDPLPGVAALLDRAQANNFELRMRRVELEEQGFRVTLARRERWPALTVEPFYESEDADVEERRVGVGFSLPLPLWSQPAANVAAAQARRLQAQASLQATWRQVERAVHQRAAAVETLRQEIAHWPADALTRFQEAADTADRHYRLGAVPVATYLEMQRQYLEALEALLATQSDYVEDRLELELVVGVSLRSPTAP